MLLQTGTDVLVKVQNDDPPSSSRQPLSGRGSQLTGSATPHSLYACGNSDEHSLADLHMRTVKKYTTNMILTLVIPPSSFFMQYGAFFIVFVICYWLIVFYITSLIAGSLLVQFSHRLRQAEKVSLVAWPTACERIPLARVAINIIH
jgi:hypothetical protein